MNYTKASFTLNEYQHAAEKTAVHKTIGHPLVYPCLGLAGETGEFVDKAKKILRNETPIDEAVRDELVKELGDVLWYVADIATQLGVDLSHVADMNIRKLADRQKRGVIKSEGDNR